MLNTFLYIFAIVNILKFEAMKRTFLISLLVVATGVMAFIGCEKEKIESPTITVTASQTTENPSANPQGEPTAVTHNTTLSYTGCHSGQRDGYETTVVTNYENGVLMLTIEDFRVNCAMDSVFSELEVDNQTINLSLRENSDAANCTCPIDVNYSIDNINPGTYELIIRHGSSWIVYQEEITCE